jgi:hypothetical protein
MPNKYTKLKPFLLVNVQLRASTYEQNIDIFKQRKAPINSGLFSYSLILIRTITSCFFLM